jgi:hypothetical protein
VFFSALAKFQELPLTSLSLVVVFYPHTFSSDWMILERRIIWKIRDLKEILLNTA